MTGREYHERIIGQMRMEEYMQYFQLKNYHRKPGSAKSSVKKALKELDDAGLLIRKFGGFSKPRHMYVMIPDKVEVSGKVQLQTDIKKADERFQK